jgi:hypothetical protein
MIAAWLSLAWFGCAGRSTPSIEQQGRISLSITNAPADATCIQVLVAGTTSVERDVDVTPGQSTVLSLEGLPEGTDTITVNAFAGSCSALTPASVPTWIGDPVVALVTRDPSDLTVTLHRNSKNGRINIGVSFDDDGGSQADGSGAGGSGTAGAGAGGSATAGAGGSTGGSGGVSTDGGSAGTDNTGGGGSGGAGGTDNTGVGGVGGTGGTGGTDNTGVGGTGGAAGTDNTSVGGAGGTDNTDGGSVGGSGGTAGTGGSAGAGGSGGSDICLPLRSDPATCGVCENLNCPHDATGCPDDCSVQPACSDYSATDAPLCDAVLTCIRVSNCVAGGVTSCYCGTASLADCLGGLGNGACKTQIEAGLKSTAPNAILLGLTNVALPGGGALSLGQCDHDSCGTPANGGNNECLPFCK